MILLKNKIKFKKNSLIGKIVLVAVLLVAVLYILRYAAYFKKEDNTVLRVMIQNKINPELETVKNKIDFLTENNKVILFLGFQNPLSANKIFNITQLIDEEIYEWKIKSNDSIEEMFATELEISLSSGDD